jgi:hypothetical protein
MRYNGFAVARKMHTAYVLSHTLTTCTLRVRTPMDAPPPLCFQRALPDAEMVGVHLLCDHLPLGAVCVVSVFNDHGSDDPYASDQRGPVVRVHALNSDASALVSGPVTIAHSARGGGHGVGGSASAAGAQVFRPPAELRCRLCADHEQMSFASRKQVAAHVAERHAGQSGMLGHLLKYDEPVGVADEEVVLMDVFASAMLESPRSHLILLASATEMNDPILSVGDVQGFVECTWQPDAEDGWEAARSMLNNSWREVSLAGHVIPERWSRDGQVHIEAVGEPFSSHAAVMVNDRTALLLVDVSTGTVTRVYPSATVGEGGGSGDGGGDSVGAEGRKIADFDVDAERCIVGVVFDDGTVDKAEFAGELHLPRVSLHLELFCVLCAVCCVLWLGPRLCSASVSVSVSLRSVG